MSRCCTITSHHHQLRHRLSNDLLYLAFVVFGLKHSLAFIFVQHSSMRVRV
ncbi:hypothetical protein HanPSC8_Chr08g0331281 [Helianthus annuus]|nr:hypothetical protein HanPSC8_Chr08g0331281 [Helianthus annuus]